ncbi:ubiquinone anaerobic biosynthesis accessory factor UbiT [Cellvibrio sp. OA-2007]|uniref:ubiquinone anaerobic biosynthesis accessory factor UbiT n=1 Tax=Cellvibrio sp. OA-2007 TaxID=529823 RepID=UPI000784E070|nr:SCP2 sterol-binding domain-containing protein [Cellvibrio sp. OA-2007]
MLYQQRVSQGVDALAQAMIPRLPSAMNWAARRVPDRLQQVALARSLNYALREAIAADELDFFCNKLLHICVKDIDVQFGIRYHRHKLVVTDAVAEPDLRFSANSYDLLLIATQQLDPDMLFFQRRLEMNGDTELGLGIKNLLASIELNAQLPPRIASVIQQVAGTIARNRK